MRARPLRRREQRRSGRCLSRPGRGLSPPRAPSPSPRSGRRPGPFRVEDRADAVADPQAVHVRAASHVQPVGGVAPAQGDVPAAPGRQVRLQPVPDAPRPAGRRARRVRLRIRAVAGARCERGERHRLPVPTLRRFQEEGVGGRFGVPPQSALQARPCGMQPQGGQGEGGGGRARHPGEPGRTPPSGPDRNGPRQLVGGRHPGRAARAPAPYGMDGVAQHDEEGVGRRVEHQAGPGESGVPRAARGRHRAHVPVLVELEAEAVLVARERGVEVGEQQVDRFLGQDAGAAVDPAVEEGPGEDREVPGAGEHPGVARHPVQAEGVLVVHLAPDQPAIETGPRRPGVLGRRDLRLPGGGRVVPGAVHSERGRDLVAEQGVQRAAGDFLQDQLQRDQVEVGVEVRAARGARRDLLPQPPSLPSRVGSSYSGIHERKPEVCVSR